MPVLTRRTVGRVFQQGEQRWRSRTVWLGSHSREVGWSTGPGKAGRGGRYAVLAEPGRIRRESGREKP